MTWPLVKPASGYSTLSRFDSVSVRLSTRTVTFSRLTDHLTWRLVGPHATPGRMAQATVARPLTKANLADQCGLDPVRAARVFAWDCVGKGRILALQGFQILAELAERLLREPGADVSGVQQLALLVRYAEKQRADEVGTTSFARLPTTDDHFLCAEVLHLEPAVRTL